MTLTNTQQTLYTAVTNIDDKYIAEVLDAKKRTAPSLPKRLAAIAATVAILLTLSYVWNVLYYGPSQVTLVDGSPFILTAVASNGSSNTNIPAYLEQLLSSYIPGLPGPTAPFGDHTLFDINIKPSEWDGSTQIGDYCKIYVKYDDTTVSIPENPDDEHLMISFTWLDGIPYYNVSGWFDEPTELTIIFEENATGTIIQEQTILVEYDEKRGNYHFSVTQIYINKEGVS